MKECRIELFVRLKGRDLVALTAKTTLQQDLGYEGILEDLSREDYWLINVQVEDEQESQAMAKELATKTKLFVNPNKHIYRIGRRDEGKGSEEEGIYEIWVLVNYFEDREGELVRETLRSTYRFGNIVEVKRGMLWRMAIRAENRKKARMLAEEMTLTRSVNKGLLINPHSQEFKIEEIL